MKFFIFSIILIYNALLFSENTPPGAFSITRIHYGGGGDWYSDPSSLPNLLEYLGDHTNIAINPLEKRAKIGDDIFMRSSYLYLTGHGNIKFTDEESQILRDQLFAGAFLHADDNFGNKHDNKRPQALGLFNEGTLMVLYTFESDLGDGWEDGRVHNDPEDIRQSALEMGTNIILYALSR